ncbi:response regulator [Aliiroseovarius sp. KMU-50]|uniref:Response regulator n=1 Tax=Aliiroseovarius salicola TaxID=3009082 RepID=A0ABT4W3T8_9RHOB|nr:response regulator [Aliiroseovarius sp. KMU-50]MDA5094645.1 response regulator [Aliiroseovarius sp. KMU-50]
MEQLERILHVDDDDDIRQIAKLTLELIGKFTVEQYASGQEAIDNAQAFAPQLILLDVMMPEMNGEATMTHLRKIPGLEEVPVVFMTAKAEAQYAEKLIRLGAIKVITKPFDPQNLCDQVQDAWASRK